MNKESTGDVLIQFIEFSDSFFTILVVFITLTGFIPLIKFYRYYKQAIASKTWPSVSGKIIRLNIESSDDIDDIALHARIIYTYTIKELPYQSSRIRIGLQWAMGRGDQADIDTFSNKYPKNQLVQVFYNPKDPRKAILEKGLDSNPFSVLYVAIIVLTIPLLLMLNEIIRANNIDLGTAHWLIHPVIIIPFAIILGVFWYKLNIWKKFASYLEVT